MPTSQAVLSVYADYQFERTEILGGDDCDMAWKQLRRQYCGGRWWPTGDEMTPIDLSKIGTTRYRYRGSVIPTPWPIIGDEEHRNTTTGLVESPVH